MVEIYECYICRKWFKEEKVYRLRGTTGMSPSSQEAEMEGRVELYICFDCFRLKKVSKTSLVE